MKSSPIIRRVRLKHLSLATSELVSSSQSDPVITREITILPPTVARGRGFDRSELKKVLSIGTDTQPIARAESSKAASASSIMTDTSITGISTPTDISHSISPASVDTPDRDAFELLEYPTPPDNTEDETSVHLAGEDPVEPASSEDQNDVPIIDNVRGDLSPAALHNITGTTYATR